MSSVYVVACRMFELVVLLTRGERSKELEILVLRVGCTNPIVSWGAVPEFDRLRAR